MLILRSSCCLAIAILLLAAAAAAQEDDLAAVARIRPAVRARRVITNDQIPPRPPEADPRSAKAAAPAPKADSAASDAPEETVKKPSDPEIATAVEQIRKQETALKEKLNRIKDKLATEEDDFRRQMWNDALENQKATLEQFRKVREKLEQQDQNSAKPASTS